MILYSVKVKIPGRLFKRKIRNIRGDAIDSIFLRRTQVVSGNEVPLGKEEVLIPTRQLTLSDGRVIMFPQTWLIEWSKERELSIKEKIDRDAKQKTPVIPGISLS